MTEAQPWPVDISLNPEKNRLTVSFDDGSSFDLDAELLRVESPRLKCRVMVLIRKSLPQANAISP